MAELPPDHPRQTLFNNLISAKTDAERLGATLAASLIGIAILCIGPGWTDTTSDPIARNDNRANPDQH